MIRSRTGRWVLDNETRKLSPAAEQSSAALARVLASPPFQSSPKLAAFLRFVVEAALAGQSDRIKGYTIGVEALGRDQNFDPQTDPIVRVEAGRLRRTLESYYASAGADDPVVIALPVGSYVPTFTFRDSARPVSLAADSAATRLRWRVGRSMLSALAATALVAVVAFGIVHAIVHLRGDTKVTGSVDDSPTAGVSHESRTSSARRLGFGLPLVEVEPVAVVGSATAGVDAAMLRERVQNALARFDEVHVLVDPMSAKAPSDIPSIDYRVAATLDTQHAGAPQLIFRLLDHADNSVVWSRSYQNLGTEAGHGVGENILLDLMSALLGPDGIIQPNDRRKRAAGIAIDPRYSCILDAYEYWLHDKFRMHERVRACIETLTAANPDFSLGFALLTYVHLRQHYFLRVMSNADVSAADQAFRAARRAVDLNPNSALAYHALSAALFARDNVEQGLAASKKAVELNPYNVAMISGFGARLIRVGEVDRGLALMRQALPYRSGLSSFYAFMMCIGSYLAGDLPGAAKYDLAAITDKFPPGLMASALVAAKTGNQARARGLVERLIAAEPAWREDPRRELAKIFHPPWMVDRLARDLAALGLGGAAADLTGSTPGPDDRKVTR